MAIILDAFGIDPNGPQVVADREDFDAFANLISELVAHRRSIGMTQADVALTMGTTQSAVSAIESSSANPTIHRLQRYARAIGVSVSLGVRASVAA